MINENMINWNIKNGRMSCRGRGWQWRWVSSCHPSWAGERPELMCRGLPRSRRWWHQPEAKLIVIVAPLAYKNLVFYPLLCKFSLQGPF